MDMPTRKSRTMMMRMLFSVLVHMALVGLVVVGRAPRGRGARGSSYGAGAPAKKAKIDTQGGWEFSGCASVRRAAGSR